MDKTDRKDTNDALHASDTLYHSLLDDLPLNVVRKDRQGKVVFGNERYCQSMKATFDDLKGKTDFDLFPPELAKKYTEDDKKVFETGETLNDIEEHKTPAGETIYVEILKGPVRDAEGNVVGVQILFWDVTERRRAEVALEHERYLLHTLLDNVPDSIY
jgi:PAS domain S-box-containing protein